MVDYYSSTVQAGFDGYTDLLLSVSETLNNRCARYNHISMIGRKKDFIPIMEIRLIIEKNNDRKCPIRYGK